MFQFNFLYFFFLQIGKFFSCKIIKVIEIPALCLNPKNDLFTRGRMWEFKYRVSSVLTFISWRWSKYNFCFSTRAMFLSTMFHRQAPPYSAGRLCHTWWRTLQLWKETLAQLETRKVYLEQFHQESLHYLSWRCIRALRKCVSGLCLETLYMYVLKKDNINSCKTEPQQSIKCLHYSQF